MRKNPEVCFEVDDINDFFNWRAVICWGVFEEIKDINEQRLAMQKLIDRIGPFLSRNEDAHPSHGFVNLTSEIGTVTDLVLYRLRVNKKTGKFEHRNFMSAAGQNQ